METMKDIQEAIKKNMPEMVGKELQDLIKEYEAKKVELREKNDIIDSLESSMKKQESELSALKKTVKTYGDLVERESVIQSKEQELAIKEAVLAVREETADLRVNDHKEMFSQVFKNRITRESVLTPIKIDNGEYSGYINGHEEKMKSCETIEEHYAENKKEEE
ncbi:MAG: hypothetical protein PQJ59_16660 [Spirochaetales bacterium]|nr:hypothetical protein [Spirochaetales bacterium]